MYTIGTVFSTWDVKLCSAAKKSGEYVLTSSTRSHYTKNSLSFLNSLGTSSGTLTLRLLKPNTRQALKNTIYPWFLLQSKCIGPYRIRVINCIFACNKQILHSTQNLRPLYSRLFNTTHAQPLYKQRLVTLLFFALWTPQCGVKKPPVEMS